MPQKTLAFLSLVVVGIAIHGTAAADPTKSRAGATIHVAVNGNDQWSGTIPRPNGQKTDGPLATLNGAKSKIRQMKQKGPLPPGGVTVLLHEGAYYLADTFRLQAADSGTAESPITYRAADGETVRIIGGRSISGFVPYRDRILKVDLASQGLKGANFKHLFFEGHRQHLARWPNFDPDNPYAGGWAYADGKHVDMFQSVPGEDRRTFQYKEKDARQWSHPEEGEVLVFPRYNWWNNIEKIAAVDLAKRTITLAGDVSYSIRPGDRYFVRNQFEELDSPGEWYLDRKTDSLYFWPPSDMTGKSVCVATLRTLISICVKTSHVTIRGLTLECCNGHAVKLDGACDCLVVGNTIRNAGDYEGSAILITGGRDNGAVGNDIYDIGSTGISISGGDRRTLTASNNYADNNYIHHVGVFYKQGVGVSLSGVGNRASHNLIHDCPRFGIFFSGNNLVMEYNHVRHVCLETEDTGAFYTGGRDWISSRGSVIRYNYVHDVIGFGQRDGKWVSPYYAWGIYLDDNAGGVDVFGNIVARASRSAIHLHNARDNHIENNTFVDNSVYQVECSGWSGGDSKWQNHLPTMVEGYESVAREPAWKNMRNMDVHPTKAVLPDGTIMSGNVLQRNIFYYRGKAPSLFRFKNVSTAHNKSDYNLAYHFGREMRIELSPPPKERQAISHHAVGWPKSWRNLGEDQHSIAADPQFENPAKDDYRLKPNSLAAKISFQPIPIDKIGPYSDQLRASWPIVEAPGAREHPYSATNN